MSEFDFDLVRGGEEWPRASTQQGGVYKGAVYRGAVFKGDVFKGDVYKGNVYKGNVYKGDVYKGKSFKGTKTRGTNSAVEREDVQHTHNTLRRLTHQMRTNARSLSSHRGSGSAGPDFVESLHLAEGLRRMRVRDARPLADFGTQRRGRQESCADEQSNSNVWKRGATDEAEKLGVHGDLAASPEPDARPISPIPSSRPVLPTLPPSIVGISREAEEWDIHYESAVTAEGWPFTPSREPNSSPTPLTPPSQPFSSTSPPSTTRINAQVSRIRGDSLSHAARTQPDLDSNESEPEVWDVDDVRPPTATMEEWSSSPASPSTPPTMTDIRRLRARWMDTLD